MLDIPAFRGQYTHIAYGLLTPSADCSDSMMQSTGLLIPSYPTSLGCDASGVVAELGAGTTGFKVGDRVCGCTRLGVPGYGTWQEFVSRPSFIYLLIDHYIVILVMFFGGVIRGFFGFLLGGGKRGRGWLANGGVD